MKVLKAMSMLLLALLPGLVLLAFVFGFDAVVMLLVENADSIFCSSLRGDCSEFSVV